MMIGGLLSIIAFCILVQAFFAASEMSLVSCNRLRIRHLAEIGSRRAKAVLGFLNVPDRFLATTLVGINIALVFGSSVASFLVSQVMGFGVKGALIATVLMLPLILILAEITPKILVRPRATAMSLFFISPLSLAYYILYPIVRVVSFLATRLVRLIGLASGPTRMFFSIEDLRLLMKEGEKQGVLTEDERRMVSRVLDFGSGRVSDIMVPLSDVVLAPEDCRVKDIWEIIHTTRYSRIPIYRSRPDAIIGTVKVTSLMGADPEEGIKPYLRPPLIVPETKSLDDLMEDFCRSGVHMAIVVEAGGKVCGIVTMENMIEEIVGQISDEYDQEEIAACRIAGESLKVPGRMRLDEIGEKLCVKFPGGEDETVAGFVIKMLGRMPVRGDRVSFGGYLFVVTRATDRRVMRLEISGPALKEVTPPAKESDLDQK